MPLGAGFSERAEQIISRYPVKRSALIMLLHEAQQEEGFLSDEAIDRVGELLGLTAADVAGVATFYTMFKRRHPGRYLISVCTNVSCAVFGADAAAERLRELIGRPHEATEDGLLSWEPVECLAWCSAAPAAQVNYEDVPQLTAERAEQLCEALRTGRPLEEVLGELRRAGTIAEAGGA